jgi:hypothetical protein
MSKRMIDTLFQKGYPIGGGLHQAMLREAEVLIVDNVSKYFYQDMECPSGWSSVDFPNCAPPYPCFWMETRSPQFSLEDGVKVPFNEYAWGALFLATDVSSLSTEERQPLFDAIWSEANIPRAELPEVKWWLMVIPFVQPFANPDSLTDLNLQGDFFIKANGHMCRSKRRVEQDEAVSFSAADIWVKEDTDGLYIERESRWSVIDREEILSGQISRQELQERVDIAGCLLYPFWLAMSFLHCKNVITAKVDPCHPKGKKKASMCCPRAHYHMLNIHPMREILRREGKQDTTGLKQALHSCRGHFRDYSQGRGLFGKHKGLYWFNQHRRGSSKHGVSIKDYMIHPT